MHWAVRLDPQRDAPTVDARSIAARDQPSSRGAHRLVGSPLRPARRSGRVIGALLAHPVARIIAAIVAPALVVVAVVVAWRRAALVPPLLVHRPVVVAALVVPRALVVARRRRAVAALVIAAVVVVAIVVPPLVIVVALARGRIAVAVAAIVVALVVARRRPFVAVTIFVRPALRRIPARAAASMGGPGAALSATAAAATARRRATVVVVEAQPVGAKHVGAVVRFARVVDAVEVDKSGLGVSLLRQAFDPEHPAVLAEVITHIGVVHL
mmetsp:Transcript_27553/g.64292  ORF Transcript_27553/g.64292 Transcript_27553/m.64292 type:complete len:269 (-) Transcript_27553:150-956(-)